jgi:hypothetical protein
MDIRTMHQIKNIMITLEILKLIADIDEFKGRWKAMQNGGGGGSRTRVRKCYWSRDYMLIPVHALGITPGRSRQLLRTDKKQLALA